jgi:hypothetical protein
LAIRQEADVVTVEGALYKVFDLIKDRLLGGILAKNAVKLKVVVRAVILQQTLT